VTFDPGGDDAVPFVQDCAITGGRARAIDADDWTTTLALDNAALFAHTQPWVSARWGVDRWTHG
jgi:hypothetical protein